MIYKDYRHYFFFNIEKFKTHLTYYNAFQNDRFKMIINSFLTNTNRRRKNR